MLLKKFIQDAKSLIFFFFLRHAGFFLGFYVTLLSWPLGQFLFQNLVKLKGLSPSNYSKC